MLMLTLFQEIKKGRCNAQKHCIVQYFTKRRRIIRAAMYVCMYVHINTDVHMYVQSHTVTPPPPLNYLSTFAHLLPRPFEIDIILFPVQIEL